MIDDKQTRIIEAAAALFATQSYEAVTTRTICARAKLGNGSLFHAFPGGKAALADTLYRDACRYRDEVVRDALSVSPDDARQAIEQVVLALMRFMTSADTQAGLLRHLGDVVTGLATGAGDRDGLAGLARVLGPWGRKMEAARAIMPTPPELLAVLLWGLVRSWTESIGFDDGAALAERIWRAIQPQAAAALRSTRSRSTSSSTPAAAQGHFSLLGTDPPDAPGAGGLSSRGPLTSH